MSIDLEFTAASKANVEAMQEEVRAHARTGASFLVDSPPGYRHV